MIDYDYDFNSYNENYITITILTFYERKNTYHASFEIIVQIRTKYDISKPLFLFLNNGIGTIFMFYFTSRKKNISELQIIPALEIIGIFKLDVRPNYNSDYHDLGMRLRLRALGRR